MCKYIVTLCGKVIVKENNEKENEEKNKKNKENENENKDNLSLVQKACTCNG